LMNHFMRQRIQDFLQAILARLVGLLEQGKGEANFAYGRRASTVMMGPWARSSTTDEHTD
jgi:hypothetical protein